MNFKWLSRGFETSNASYACSAEPMKGYVLYAWEDGHFQVATTWVGEGEPDGRDGAGGRVLAHGFSKEGVAGAKKEAETLFRALKIEDLDRWISYDHNDTKSKQEMRRDDWWVLTVTRVGLGGWEWIWELIGGSARHARGSAGTEEKAKRACIDAYWQHWPKTPAELVVKTPKKTPWPEGVWFASNDGHSWNAKHEGWTLQVYWEGGNSWRWAVWEDFGSGVRSGRDGLSLEEAMQAAWRTYERSKVEEAKSKALEEGPKQQTPEERAHWLSDECGRLKTALEAAKREANDALADNARLRMQLDRLQRKKSS